MFIKTVNLKADMPPVREALERFDWEITRARQEGISILKIIHGYGSGGSGGDIRIAVQKRLHDLKECGDISAYIFGEAWSKSDDTSWQLLKAHPELKSDLDLGRGNRGISFAIMRVQKSLQ